MNPSERRQTVHLTDAQIDAIAEKAAEKALQKVYAEVGKNIVTKLFWLVGVVGLAMLLFLTGKGVIKLG